MTDQAALDVQGLSVVYRAGSARVRALDRVDLTVPAGRRLAVVGESGSGKSTLGLAVMGLLPKNATFEYERIAVGGQLLDLRNQRDLRTRRGREMSMVFQDAKASLDPVRTVGSQIAEPLRAHRIVGRRQVGDEVVRLLTAVEVPHAEAAARQYPHELSGGMRQRAMIAAALAGRPTVLIADEPTSALDVTTQATVIDLVRRIGDGAMATLLITHDLALVAGFAETVAVLYAGQIVEVASVDEIYTMPRHPYTRALLGSVPSLFGERMTQLGSIPGSLPDLGRPSSGCRFEPRCSVGHGRDVCRHSEPALDLVVEGGVQVRCHFPGELPATSPATAEITVSVTHRDSASSPVVAELRGLRKSFARKGQGRRGRSRTIAVNGVDLTIRQGESVGVVGESGSGKTTLARIFVGLERADDGERLIREGAGLVSRSSLPPDYVQFVFQDPGDSLDPLMSVGEIIAEPLVLRDGGRASRYRDRVSVLLQDVGLRAEMIDRRPMELSGGQRQRVAIARALSTQPKVIIADEAVASLDMSARGQILNLFSRLQAEHGFAYLYISHDLSMVRHVCDRVVVMYGGQVMETASTDELFVAPRHPYTQALILAVPVPDPAIERRRGLVAIRGELTDDATARGCVFRTRCPIARERCQHETPRLERHGSTADDHGVACHFVDDAAELFRRTSGATMTSRDEMVSGERG